jgi:hypothetical protein
MPWTVRKVCSQDSCLVYTVALTSTSNFAPGARTPLVPRLTASARSRGSWSKVRQSRDGTRASRHTPAKAKGKDKWRGERQQKAVARSGVFGRIPAGIEIGGIVPTEDIFVDSPDAFGILVAAIQVAPRPRKGMIPPA